MLNLRQKISELEEEIVSLTKQSENNIVTVSKTISELKERNQIFIVESVKNIEDVSKNICEQIQGNGISKDFFLNYFLPFIKREFEMSLTEEEEKRVNSIFEKTTKTYKKYDRPKTVEDKTKFIKTVMREEPLIETKYLNYDEEVNLEKDKKKFNQELKYNSLTNL